jgi:SNF2 family DNA or RNA helicase
MQAIAAAHQVAAAVEDSLQIRVDLDPKNRQSTDLLKALRRYETVSRAVGPVRDTVRRMEQDLPRTIAAARPAASRLRMFFSGRRRKEAALDALARVRTWVHRAESSGALQAMTAAHKTIAKPSLSDRQIWKDFQRRAPEYYGLLGEVVELKQDVAAAEGLLPADVVARVNEQQLDDTFRRVSLRGYQSFGARFALVQRRVIIGDEMGLGKTIQAIAAMAHLKANGATHFLVVCPASVLINWTREIAARSAMVAYRLHGPERASGLKSWIRFGDVGVTTYESLRALRTPGDLRVSMLVVDEAHYVKNPGAQRSRNTSAWTSRADRVLFLTGTPMENRADEFRNLVGYLRPEVASMLSDRTGMAGPDAFRKAVAPVYLRRNQSDVLTELPELVQVDEWEEFSAHDFREYRRAVRAGNFMAMRRAAFASADPEKSAKLKRLIEIADEASANDHKVVVFSYFRDVLRTVHASLGKRAYGPLTGEMPPPKRQALIDAFTRTDEPGVLVAQIQAGGVGLNMQAASIVVLCEPQVKPTTESQAIARAHRMGQVRTVQVHRLLIADSVDQRMLEILDSKTRLFDEYARRSDIADGSPHAHDISEVELARQVVAREQERLAMESIAEPGIQRS